MAKDGYTQQFDSGEQKFFGQRRKESFLGVHERCHGIIGIYRQRNVVVGHGEFEDEALTGVVLVVVEALAVQIEGVVGVGQDVGEVQLDSLSGTIGLLCALKQAVCIAKVDGVALAEAACEIETEQHGKKETQNDAGAFHKRILLSC